jgi:hypothetical protein
MLAEGIFNKRRTADCRSITVPQRDLMLLGPEQLSLPVSVTSNLFFSLAVSRLQEFEKRNTVYVTAIHFRKLVIDDGKDEKILTISLVKGMNFHSWAEAICYKFFAQSCLAEATDFACRTRSLVPLTYCRRCKCGEKHI